MRVNGKDIELKRGMTLTEFLAEHNYRAELVAVERNGQIVPRTEFGAAVLTDGDELEIVSFVGGG
mgnify:FL=1